MSFHTFYITKCYFIHFKLSPWYRWHPGYGQEHDIQFFYLLYYLIHIIWFPITVLIRHFNDFIILIITSVLTWNSKTNCNSQYHKDGESFTSLSVKGSHPIILIQMIEIKTRDIIAKLWQEYYLIAHWKTWESNWSNWCSKNWTKFEFWILIKIWFILCRTFVSTSFVKLHTSPEPNFGSNIL